MSTWKHSDVECVMMLDGLDPYFIYAGIFQKSNFWPGGPNATLGKKNSKPQV